MIRVVARQRGIACHCAQPRAHQPVTPRRLAPAQKCRFSIVPRLQPTLRHAQAQTGLGPLVRLCNRQPRRRRINRRLGIVVNLIDALLCLACADRRRDEWGRCGTHFCPPLDLLRERGAPNPGGGERPDLRHQRKKNHRKGHGTSFKREYRAKTSANRERQRLDRAQQQRNVGVAGQAVVAVLDQRDLHCG